MNTKESIKLLINHGLLVKQSYRLRIKSNLNKPLEFITLYRTIYNGKPFYYAGKIDISGDTIRFDSLKKAINYFYNLAYSPKNKDLIEKRLLRKKAINSEDIDSDKISQKTKYLFKQEQKLIEAETSTEIEKSKKTSENNLLNAIDIALQNNLIISVVYKSKKNEKKRSGTIEVDFTNETISYIAGLPLFKLIKFYNKEEAINYFCSKFYSSKNYALIQDRIQNKKLSNSIQLSNSEKNIKIVYDQESKQLDQELKSMGVWVKPFPDRNDAVKQVEKIKNNLSNIRSLKIFLLEFEKKYSTLGIAIRIFADLGKYRSMSFDYNSLNKDYLNNKNTFKGNDVTSLSLNISINKTPFDISKDDFNFDIIHFMRV